MPKKHKKFADDGWAVWIDGEEKIKRCYDQLIKLINKVDSLDF